MSCCIMPVILMLCFIGASLNRSDIVNPRQQRCKIQKPGDHLHRTSVKQVAEPLE